MDNELHQFQYHLMRNGLNYDYDDVKYLFSVAKQCAKTFGVASGLTAGTMMAGAGSVTIPGVGAVPGYVAGFLAGMVGGTAICTLQRASMKPGLDQLLRDTQE